MSLGSALRACLSQRDKRHLARLRRLRPGASLCVGAVLLAAMLVMPALAADKEKAKTDKPAKPKLTKPPLHDPADIGFRRAPMANALRSVVIPLATNVHLAFDTELLRTHTVWQGGTLDVWGTPYHGGKDRYYGTFEGTALWTNAPLAAWSVSGSSEKAGRFTGISTKGGMTSFRYEVGGAKGAEVWETPRVEMMEGTPVLVRRLQLGPATRELNWLAHVGGGKLAKSLPGAVVVQREKDVLLVVLRGTGATWDAAEKEVAYEARIAREQKNDTEFDTHKFKGRELFASVKIAAHPAWSAIEVASVVLPDVAAAEQWVAKLKAGTVAAPNAAFLTSNAKDEKAVAPRVTVGDKTVFPVPAGDEFFRVEHFPLPKEIELRVNGLDFLPNGDMAVCTWTGEIYIVQKPEGDVKAATYRRFARGLCEPCGLRVINGQIYVVQKQELTRVLDTDGNGEADLFECINQDWGYTGNYHDFSYGPLLDKQGNFYVYRTGNRGIYEVPHMGWALKISQDGRTLEPWASGFRSPNGFAEYGPNMDLFMTDNQGNWIGACTLTHVQKGRFYGFPSTIPAPKEDYKGRSSFDPPAVWFPYTMAKSASSMTEIKDDRFGPFKGQMLVGDFQNAIVMRVALEKVNGEYQGAVWPFSKGYWSGVNRLGFGPDGKLYVGGLKNVAWAAVAPKDWSLERVSFTGKIPFEVKEVHAKTDGFELTFTQPADPATAGVADNYDLSQYRYEYHQAYGSPEFDHDGKKDSATSIKVTKATVTDGGTKVRLTVEGWKAGYVTVFRVLDVRNADGKALWHDAFYYTLNQIPKN